MPEDARAAILSRLRATPPPPPLAPMPPASARGWSLAEKRDRFARMMTAAHAELFETSRDGWPRFLHGLLVKEGIGSLAHGMGVELATGWPAEGPVLVPYAESVEEGGFKERLFSGIDAGLTTTLGAIAETGSLMLWPSPDEPRLLSLVPPLHIALLDADSLYETFAEAISVNNWTAGMPTNALLISGPSKTADIEQTLAYGVHGPKRLWVVVLS